MAEESARPGTCRSKVGCEAMDEPCTNKILPAGPEGSPACLFHRNRRTSLPLSVQCSSPRMTAVGEMGLFTGGTPRSRRITAVTRSPRRREPAADPKRPADRGAAEKGDEFAPSHLPSPRSGPREPVAYPRNFKITTLDLRTSNRVHSGFMSLALMTLAHLSISDCTKAPNSSGFIDMVSAPCFLHASFMSARARILLISAFRRVTIGCGVPAGAM